MKRNRNALHARRSKKAKPPRKPRLRKRKQKVSTGNVIFDTAVTFQVPAKEKLVWEYIVSLIEEHAFNICKDKPSFYARALNTGLQIMRNFTECPESERDILNYEVYPLAICLEETSMILRGILQESDVRGESTKLKMANACVVKSMSLIQQKLIFSREAERYMGYLDRYFEDGAVS